MVPIFVDWAVFIASEEVRAAGSCVGIATKCRPELQMLRVLKQV